MCKVKQIRTDLWSKTTDTIVWNLPLSGYSTKNWTADTQLLQGSWDGKESQLSIIFA